MSSVRPVRAGNLDATNGPVSNRSGQAFGVVLKTFSSDRSASVHPSIRIDGADAALLQEIRREDEDRRNRAQLQRGRDMLGLLARMQRDLIGADEEHAADRAANDMLETLRVPGPDAADAALGRIVQAIALRLKVELARRETAGP